jgi:hypothetical protein
MNWEILLMPWHDQATIPSSEIVDLIRQWRNAQLASSDWTQLPDVTIADKTQWAAYRQELRDMLKQNDDPKLIVFPEPPK